MRGQPCAGFIPLRSIRSDWCYGPTACGTGTAQSGRPRSAVVISRSSKARKQLHTTSSTTSTSSSSSSSRSSRSREHGLSRVSTYRMEGTPTLATSWGDFASGKRPAAVAEAAAAGASHDHGPPGGSQQQGLLQRVLASRLGMQGQGPLQRYSGRYLTMSPEEFEKYFPHYRKSAEGVAADVSVGKAAVPTSGFHQLLVVPSGDKSDLQQLSADQEGYLLAGVRTYSGDHKGVLQHLRHPPCLQQQGTQHMGMAHQHAPAAAAAAADAPHTGGGLGGATHSAVVLDKEAVGHGSSSHVTHRSVFGLPTIAPNHSLPAAWLLVMLFVDLTYTAFVCPVNIAVGWIEPFNEAWILEAIIGFLFVVDLLLGFHVQYAVRCRFTRCLMKDGRAIARYYVRRGNFLLALFSTAPWVLLFGVQLPWTLATGVEPHVVTIVLQLLTGVRILRLWRVLRMVSGFYRGAYLAGYSASRPGAVGALYFLSIAFSVAVYINVLACLWYMTARLQGFSDSWLQKVNGEDLSDPNMSSARQYLAAVYLVVMAITTNGDVFATSDGERVLGIVTMLAGSLFLSFLISVLVDTMNAINQHGQSIERYRQRLQAVDAWMQDMQLPTRLADAVYAYYNFTWLQQQEDKELWTRCLEDLPPALRAQVAYNLLEPYLEQLEVFHGLTPNQLMQVVQHMQAQRLAPGDLLCEQGDAMDGIWVLKEGQLDLVHYGRWCYTISAPEVVGVGAVLTLLGSNAGEVDAAVRRNLHPQHRAPHHCSTGADTGGAGDQTAQPMARVPEDAEAEPDNTTAFAAVQWPAPKGEHRFRPYTLRCRGSVKAWHLPMAALESLVVRFPVLQERLLKLWEERWATGLEGPGGV